MKKAFSIPFILPMEGGGDGNETGLGTGQGGVTLTPMDFDSWFNSEWCEDYIQDDSIDMYDFGAWWDACGFTFQQWLDKGYTAEQWEEYVGS